MISCGETKESIARAIGIDAETLNKHFHNELATGLAVQRAAVIDGLYRQAAKGNVAALKKLEEMTRVAAAQSSFVQPEQSTGARAERLSPQQGKKEQAQAAAKEAGQGTGWGNDLAVPAAKMN
jgi:urease accessory protein UreF